jgi:hypothetical protein
MIPLFTTTARVIYGENTCNFGANPTSIKLFGWRWTSGPLPGDASTETQAKKKCMVFNNFARHEPLEAIALKTIHLFVRMMEIDGPCLWPVFAVLRQLQSLLKSARWWR